MEKVHFVQYPVVSVLIYQDGLSSEWERKIRFNEKNSFHLALCESPEFQTSVQEMHDFIEKRWLDKPYNSRLRIVGRLFPSAWMRVGTATTNDIIIEDNCGSQWDITDSSALVPEEKHAFSVELKLLDVPKEEIRHVLIWAQKEERTNRVIIPKVTKWRAHVLVHDFVLHPATIKKSLKSLNEVLTKAVGNHQTTIVLPQIPLFAYMVGYVYKSNQLGQIKSIHRSQDGLFIA